MIPGFATPEATSDWTRRHPSIASATLGRSGLTCTRAGFGGYRINTASAHHREALELALRRGINLIDTSANYADGHSEALVGQVMAALVAKGALAREAIIIVTKAGYLQGQNYALSQKRKQQGNPFQDLVTYAENLEHCIHPEFLEDQITRSLSRLGIDCIDVLLLHNPEYYLSWAAKQKIALEAARDVYAERIRRAFAHLEKEVDRGRIRFYGISSNTFTTASDRTDFTSLSRIQACAEDVRPDHHLAVIQFPMNLFESGAVLEVNQPEAHTLLTAARKLDLGTLVNRPLNAFTGSRLIRLADVPNLEPLPPKVIAARLQDLSISETHFFKDILPGLDLDASVASQITQQLAMAESLASHYDRYASYENWLQIQSDHILPRAVGVLAYLEQQASGGKVAEWSERYRTHLNAVLNAVSAFYAPKAASQIESIKSAVRHADPAWDLDGPLSQMAIRAIHTTRGIHAVLVGMRQAAYVDDVLAALTPEPAAEDRTTSWEKLRTCLETED
ncbi:MAG: aldo/keto reductase [Desulfobacterales bacterium]|nr:aldo/keto reductase [Desulfobacterales bacterium]